MILQRSEACGPAAILTMIAILAVFHPALAHREEAAAAPRVPFAFADFSWVPSNAGASERPLTAGPFTGEFRLDDAYHYSFSNPKDGTISGSSEVFRHGEFQVTQLGIGGDVLYQNVMGRVMTQFGMYSTATPRNDASPGRGQWQLDDAYRYLSEAYGGVHFDALDGINVQGGIFMSYIGLWSYYNADNWTYQPSYVSSNTPWFFNGIRAQIFTSDKLKIEPWLVNGWQSYGRFNKDLGTGGQIIWRPTGSLGFVLNQYIGNDTFGNSKRRRLHTDDSFMMKYRDRPGSALDKAAFSVTLDAGGESGAVCRTARNPSSGSWPTTAGGSRTTATDSRSAAARSETPGATSCSCRRSTGATALSGTPYFTGEPGPIVRRLGLPDRGGLRAAAVRDNPRGITTTGTRASLTLPATAASPPPGGNQGLPGSTIPNWAPDLVQDENRLSLALLVKL